MGVHWKKRIKLTNSTDTHTHKILADLKRNKKQYPIKISQGTLQSLRLTVRGQLVLIIIQYIN